MTKLTLITASLVLALTAACGDNLQSEGDLERDDLVIIIPNAGEAIDALESAELAGFTEPVFFEDAGYISAVGDLSLADEAMGLPGISDVLPADSLSDDGAWNDRVVWDRGQSFDLGAAATRVPGDYWEQRADWNGELALDNVPDAVKRDRAIDWDNNLERR